MAKFNVQIQSDTGTPLANLSVEVIINLTTDEAVLSTVKTDSKGFSTVEIDELQLRSFIRVNPDAFVYFKIYKQNSREILKDSIETERWLPADPSEFVIIIIEMEEVELPLDYSIKGLVKDSDSGLPLKNVTVKGFIITTRQEKEFGEVRTGRKGEFIFLSDVIQPILKKDVAGRSILFRIHKEGQDKPLTEFIPEIKWNRNSEIVPVTIEADLTPEIPSLDENLRWNLAPELISYLESNNIRTIDEIRKYGRIASLKEKLPHVTEQVDLLEAHGRLAVLPSTTFYNNELVMRGIDSVHSILNYSEEEFISKLDNIPRETAEEIYRFAGVYNQNINNSMAAHRTYAVKNEVSDFIDDLFPISCDCDDCQQASSPTAYLADLLNYTLEHLRYNSNAVNLSWLEQRFHQPFRKLPTDCQSQKEPIRQVRICIEVLRDLLPAPHKSKEFLPYLQSIYTQFLELYGTSYKEMRDLRAMEDRSKMEISERLQIPWISGGHSYIDDLYMDLNAAPGSSATFLSEGWIENIFGLLDTTKPPPTSIVNENISRFAELRLRYWNEKWLKEDSNIQTFILGSYPLLDPDNININDVVSKPQIPTPANKWNLNEADFLYQRSIWINQVIITLEQYRTSVPVKSFNDMLVALGQNFTIPNVNAAVMHGVTVTDLVTQRANVENGINIDSWLTQRKLSIETFYRLSDFALLERRNLPMTKQEWEEFYDIIIQQAKIFEINDVWREEEFRKDQFNNADLITITSKYLKSDTSTESTNQWRPKQWRSDAIARKKIRQLIKSRVGIEDSIKEQARNAIETVESSSLVHLRDELLRTAATLGLLTGPSGSLITLERLKWFTRHYQVDSQGGACHITTRIAQAIETLQGVLNGARIGLLEDLTLSLNNLETFDQDWLWLGSFSNWKAAMLVFLYPENSLRPTLRRRQSPGFRNLVDELRNAGAITPTIVEQIVGEYDQYFIDICNLQLTGTCKGTPLGSKSKIANWNYFLGASSISGKLYFSYTDEDESPSHWNLVKIPDLGGGISDFVSFGLTLYMPNDRERFLYIFAGNPSSGIPFGYSRTNIVAVNSPDDLRWSLFTPLVLPNDSKNLYNAAIFSHAPTSVPELVVALTPTLIYFRRLNESATAWSAADFVEADLPKTWVSLGKFSCTSQAFNSSVKPVQITVGDFDGDGFDEVAIIPEYRAPDYNDIWIMKYQNNAWKHLSPINGSSLESDLRCSTTAYSASDMIAGDFDGDGKDELIVSASSAMGNSGIAFAFWMYKLNSNGTWVPQGVRSQSPEFFAYFEVSYTYISSEFMKVGDFDGDGIDEVAFKVYSPLAALDIKSQNNMWIFKYNPSTRVWNREKVTMDPAHNNYYIKDAVVMDFDKNGNDEILALKYGPDSTIGNDFWNAQYKDHIWKVTDNELDLSNEEISVDYPLGGSFDGINYGILARQEKTDKYWIFHKNFGSWQGLPVVSSGPVKYYFSLDIDGDLRDEIVEVQNDTRIAIHDWTGTAWTKFNPPGAFGNDKFQLLKLSCAKGRFADKAAEQFIYWTAGTTQNTFDVGYLQTDLSLFTSQSPLFEKLKPSLSVNAFIYKNKKLPQVQKDIQNWNLSASAISKGSLGPVNDYLEEMFYFVPVEIALRLNKERFYTEAFDWFRLVYNFALPTDQRRISFKLSLELDYEGFFRIENWIADPLQPHLIAESRSPSYTRYTLFCIIRCLLENADAEFTRATSESVAMAMDLYLKAHELLEAQEMNFRKAPCSDLIGRLESIIGEDETDWVYEIIFEEINRIEKFKVLNETISKLEPILKSNKEPLQKWSESKPILEKATHHSHNSTLEEKVNEGESRKKQLETFLASEFLKNKDGFFKKETTGVQKLGKKFKYREVVTPAPSLSFCIPPNAVVQSLRKRVDVNLVKMRSCRNIAGLPLKLEPYSSPSVGTASAFDQLPVPLKTNLRPLPYRYGSLIERTKQLIELAWQMEQSMLQNISSAEQEKYQILKARQDLGLAEAAVQLRNLQIGLAEHGVKNSALQIDKALEQFEHYNNLVSSGLNYNEEGSLVALGASALLKGIVGTMYITAGAIPSADSILSFGASNASNIASGMSSLADAASTTSSLFSSVASFERRRQQWVFNRQSSQLDVRAAQEQYSTAWTQVKIANEEKDVAVLQTTYAVQVLDYLNIGKFLNYDLYEWMSSIIEGIYHFFLQQATAMAQLAESQLAFERQEVIPVFIKADYWEPISENQTTASNSQTSDRRGLTGSARLLRDIYELDQFAFRTNKRKLQLSETFSLLQLDPVAFNQFKETGVLNFDTPMYLFNSKFPGHYLRLVRTVRISVIALIPPAFGIRATLANIGSSKVVLGPDSFETVDIRRDSEIIAFTSPISSTGLFELDVQPELLFPFEGIGVDSRWQFELPKVSNPFDFETIADVLFTVEYTALNSYDYRNEIIKKLPTGFTADRVFSFRNNLSDVWYDLNNPDLTEEPMKVKFRTTANDFPNNIIRDTLTINHVVLYFIKSDNDAFNTPLPVSLELAEKDGLGNTIGGTATTSNGLLSTKSGNASAWNAIIGKDPSSESIIGQGNAQVKHSYREWILKLPNDINAKKLFNDEKIKDILLVITYTGDLPMWPN